MLKYVGKKIDERRRRRSLIHVRRKFAECGYSLDHLDDLKIEGALTLGRCRIDQIDLSAKSMSFALRRLAVNRKNRAAN